MKKCQNIDVVFVDDNCFEYKNQYYMNTNEDNDEEENESE